MKKGKIAAKRMKELKQAIRDQERKNTVDALKNELINGKAEIHVNVDELYNPLSFRNVLNDDIFDYIETRANLLPSMVPLRVILHGVPHGEQSSVPTLVMQHYQSVMQDHLWDKRSNTYKMLSMILIGVLFLGAYIILAVNREDSLFLEILSIIGSFSLWEAANCYLVERRDIRRALMETAQFLTMEIICKE